MYTPTNALFWPNGAVKVCYLPSALSPAPDEVAWRNNVRTWLTTLLQPFAHLSFTGFGACVNPTSDWIQINVVNDSGSDAHSDGRTATNVIDFGTQRTFQRVVLHELMHKLGFGHEFNRTDADGCPAVQPGAIQSGTYWTPYDHYSIMNVEYCIGVATTELTALDRAGLRMAYGDEEAPELDGSVGRRIAVGRQADGRLDVFFAGPSQALYHNIQNSPGGTWSGPIQLGGAAKQLVVAPNQDGRLELIYIGTDNHLYHNFQTTPNGSWNGQVDLGGDAKQIALGRNTNGTLELLYVGTNDLLYHNWQTVANGNWNGQMQLSAANERAKQVAVARNEDGRLEVFYIDANDVINHRWQLAPHGNWSGQVSLDNLAKQLLVARNEDGRLELFYTGPNDSIYHRWQTASGWSTQTYLFGGAKRLAVTRNPGGRLEIFYVGTNDAIYHDYQIAAAGDWSHELGMGGAGRDIIAGRNADGRLEITYIGTNGFLYHNWRTATGWSGEALLGGDINDPPAPTCPANGACMTATDCHHAEGTSIGQLSCAAGTVCCTF